MYSETIFLRHSLRIRHFLKPLSSCQTCFTGSLDFHSSIAQKQSSVEPSSAMMISSGIIVFKLTCFNTHVSFSGELYVLTINAILIIKGAYFEVILLIFKQGMSVKVFLFTLPITHKEFFFVSFNISFDKTNLPLISMVLLILKSIICWIIFY